MPKPVAYGPVDCGMIMQSPLAIMACFIILCLKKDFKKITKKKIDFKGLLWEWIHIGPLSLMVDIPLSGLYLFIYFYGNQSYQSVNLEIWSMVLLCSMPFK